MEVSPNIIHTEKKTLVGFSKETSLVNDRTRELFSRFMLRLREIPQIDTSCVYDLKEYPLGYFNAFNPGRTFIKWALAELTAETNLPPDIKSYELPAGQYAVFYHEGPHSDHGIFQQIFKEWLPASHYELDNRPHFDIIPIGKNHYERKAAQEIWIPVIKRIK